MNALQTIQRKCYKARYSVEYFERKKIPSYALWCVFTKNEKGHYHKIPDGYGKTETLEQAYIELTEWCQSRGLEFEQITDSMSPWRLVKDLLEGKKGAEYFARTIKKRTTYNQVIEQHAPKNDLVHVVDGKAFCDSLTIAEKFKKRHDNVLQAFDNLPKDNFRLLNFQESSYLNTQGKEQRKIEMTWKGFSMLAMGFTGREAYQWKQDFLDAFEAMGEYIKRQLELVANPTRTGIIQDKRNAHNPMMDALIEFREDQGKETEVRHFQCENKLCNGVVTGKYTKCNESELTNSELELLTLVRKRNEAFLMSGIDYQERKKRLIAFTMKYRTKLISVV